MHIEHFFLPKSLMKKKYFALLNVPVMLSVHRSRCETLGYAKKERAADKELEEFC